MSCAIRLALAIHNHQPIGNFDGVFEEAYQDSYAPFLDVLAEYPDLPVSLHISGSLLEWLEQAHPEYIDQIRELAARGQIEMLGGPFFEPILACIPRHDRIGQIQAYSQHLKQVFGVDIRGMWVPERVWEQTFASDIARAGIEFTILDDYHFRSAGLEEDQLFNYFLTEDEGQLLKIFPGSEKLRYTIPFADPQETIGYLRDIGTRHPNSVIAFGDDGEKFGTWPGTKKHVYQDGWLRRFFDALLENREWLKVVTLGEAVDTVAPADKVYLADCSYREMTEWALPPDRQIALHDLSERKQNDPDWAIIRMFLRGGFWRNFRAKYPESNEQYCRMLEVSGRLQKMQQEESLQSQASLLNAARLALYRAQCNCSYWHGAFGGLYLPHLRNAVYQQLIEAENLLDQAEGRTGPWVRIDVNDYNRDARKEVRLASDRLIGYLAPSQGGHLYELDVRNIPINVLATLNRRPEAYHETVRQHGAQSHADGTNGDGVASIHDLVHFKQPDLDKKLNYDHWLRKSLVDHFLQPGLSVDEFAKSVGEVGDFATGVYDAVVRTSDRRVESTLTRNGKVGPYPVRISKTISLASDQGQVLDVRYELEELPPDVPLHFGIEFNFAAMAGNADDRYFYDANGNRAGTLDTVQAVPQAQRIGLVDEWLGLDVSLDISRNAEIWTLPIQTISQSESGFELVHQSCVVLPHWEFKAPADGRWSVQLQLTLDTSAAQARKLSKVNDHLSEAPA